jgi:hypothetical protein
LNNWTSSLQAQEVLDLLLKSMYASGECSAMYEGVKRGARGRIRVAFR